VAALFDVGLSVLILRCQRFFHPAVKYLLVGFNPAILALNVGFDALPPASWSSAR
jgi:hypothetical protein